MRPLARLLITMIVMTFLATLAIDIIVDAKYPPGPHPIPTPIPARSVDHN